MSTRFASRTKTKASRSSRSPESTSSTMGEPAAAFTNRTTVAAEGVAVVLRIDWDVQFDCARPLGATRREASWQGSVTDHPGSRARAKDPGGFGVPVLPVEQPANLALQSSHPCWHEHGGCKCWVGSICNNVAAFPAALRVFGPIPSPRPACRCVAFRDMRAPKAI
jgi:hypothetical protein